MEDVHQFVVSPPQVLLTMSPWRQVGRGFYRGGVRGVASMRRAGGMRDERTVFKRLGPARQHLASAAWGREIDDVART